MLYSQTDHYKWGWANGWFNKPQNPGDKFRVSIGSCVDGHKSFREECIRTCQDLANQFTLPILVGLSGGSDSQVVCLSLLEAKIPFTPLILRLLDHKGIVRNAHDIKGAFAFCKKWNLEPIIEELDLRAYYLGLGKELATEHYLTNVRTLIQLAMVEKYRVTNAFIMAGGDMVVSKLWTRQTDDNDLVTSFGPTPIQQHLIANNIEGCTKFFMYSPELIAAYLDNQVMRGFAAGHEAIYQAWTSTPERESPKTWWGAFNLFVKPLFYAEQFPELLHRKKYHGFEEAEEVADLGRLILRNTAKTFKIDEERKKIIIPLQDVTEHVLTGRGAEKIWSSNASEMLMPKPPAGLGAWLRETY